MSQVELERFYSISCLGEKQGHEIAIGTMKMKLDIIYMNYKSPTSDPVKSSFI